MEATDSTRIMVLFKNAEHFAKFRKNIRVRGIWKQLDDHTILCTQGIAEAAQGFGASIKMPGRRKAE